MIRVLALAAALTLLAAEVRAQSWKYEFSPPSGWRQAEANGAVIMTSPDDGALVLLQPPVPLGADFEAQAEAARTNVETAMKLRDAQLAPLQRGGGEARRHLMFGGSYDSDGGPRYVMLYAMAQQGAFGAAVFVATSHTAFGRRAREATAMFNGLRIAPGTELLAAPPPVSPSAVESPEAAPPLSSVPPPQTGDGGSLPNVGREIAIPSNNALTGGATLADLTGVWVADTIIRNDRISLGYFTGAWGNQFWGSSYTMGTPMGAGGTYLKVRPDGSYEYWYNHVDRGCDWARGHAGNIFVQNGVAVLRAARAHERAGPARPGASCQQYDRDAALAQKSYKIEIGSYSTPFGYPTYRLRLNNVDGSSDYMVLDRVEARPLPGAAVPPNFKIGSAQAAGDLQGIWVAAGDGANSPTQPDPNKYFGILRFLPGGRYELTVNSPDVLYAPVCTKSLQLQETGAAQFQGEIDRYDNKHEGGTVVLTPSQSHLTAEVVRCGLDTTPKQTFDLPAAPRYLKWDLKMQNPVTAAPLPGDKLQVICPNAYEPAAAWQFLSCPQSAGQVYDGYMRR